MDGPPPQLDYAPRPPRWRKAKKRILIAAILSVLAIIAWRIEPFAWWYVRVIYWQQRCLNYEPPPGTVIGPLGATKPHFVPTEWDHLADLFSQEVSSFGTLFLHERVSPGGQRRLVAVDNDLMTHGSNPEQEVRFTVRLVNPGSLLSLPNETNASIMARGTIPADSVFYPGQSDPADPSHFTIRATKDGKETIIDGWLQDDDRVLLEPRKAPASAP